MRKCAGQDVAAVACFDADKAPGVIVEGVVVVVVVVVVGVGPQVAVVALVGRRRRAENGADVERQLRRCARGAGRGIVLRC